MELLFLSLSFGEISVVLLLVLLLFGSKKLPELARGLGKGIREFKDATGEIQREIRSGMNEAEKPIRQVGESINSEARKK